MTIGILGALTYRPNAKFALARSYLSGFAVGWFHQTVVLSGQTTVLEEHVFGGYRFVLKWKDKVWGWNSNAYTLDYLIEDAYAMAPGSSTPIPFGTARLDYEIDNVYQVPSVVFSLDPNDGCFTFQQFPPPDSGYWNKPAAYPIPTPFRLCP